MPPTEVTSGSDDGQEFTRYGYRVYRRRLVVGRSLVARSGEHRHAVRGGILERVAQVSRLE